MLQVLQFVQDDANYTKGAVMTAPFCFFLR